MGKKEMKNLTKKEHKKQKRFKGRCDVSRRKKRFQKNIA